MVEWTRAVTSQDQEHGSTGHRNEVEREQNDELEDLAKRKRRIDCTGGWGTETTDRVAGLGVNNPRGKHKLFLTLVYQDRVEYIHQSLIHKEGLEQGSNYSGAFTQHQKRAVHPCADTLENSQEGYLRQVCEEEEEKVNEAREEDDGKEAGLE